MSKQSWRGSTLLNPEPPVLVSCGGLEQPNLITIGWTGTICTQPSMVSISVRPERYSHHLIKESGQFAINLPTESLVRAIDWCGVKSGRDVDESLLDENGKLCLDKAKLIVYSHGEYLSLGKKLGTFGYSVRKKKPGKRKK